MPPAAGKDSSEQHALIALVGNPNTGKTTLFNQLTGARARVGNYPGITVERRSGTMAVAQGRAELLDLPGTYSLSARSPDEQIALQAVAGLDGKPRPDLVVVVVDAGQLLRNLYLVVQLIELNMPLVVAANMADELREPIDCDALQRVLGVPVVSLSARSGAGIDKLRATISAALVTPPISPVAVAYPAEIRAAAAALRGSLPARWHPSDERAQALALWALCSIADDDELRGIDDDLRAACKAQQQRLNDVDGAIISARYAYLDQHVAAVLAGAAPNASPSDEPPQKPALQRQRTTDRVDRVLLHPVWGFAVFISLMIVLFQALFSWSDPAISAIENLFGWFAAGAANTLPAGVITDMVVEGVIGGVGNVVVFLPQILFLFLLLGFLEDSGYMARVAFLMDRIMRAVGLPGRAFVPMLSGCACAIPAIMATRTMARERDRLLTMLVIPLMTCSARLPVYTLIIAALFPPTRVFGLVPVQGLLMVIMYLFSTVTALLAAAVIGRTAVKGRRIPLLLELPPYRLPTLRSVLRQMVERASVFLKEAGTVILACTIVLWGILSYPKLDTPRPLHTRAVAGWQYTLPQSAAGARAPRWHNSGKLDVAAMADNSAAVGVWRGNQLRNSYGGKLGKALEPAISPLGFDWKLGVGLIGAFAAREVFVSTMGLVYGIGDADEQSQPLRDKIHAERRADGTPVYTPLMGLSLLIFFALSCQCMSTLAVVKRETRSWRWPLFLFAYMTTLAWVCSFVVYQGGKLLGLS